MLKELIKYKNTFEDFKKFLFYHVYNKDSKEFKKFTVLPEDIVIAKLVEYLEFKGVPIFDAFLYYRYKYEINFKDSTKLMIGMEFKRMENNIKCNYIPF